MNELQEKYRNSSKRCQLQIFGFPSNQFGYQEPAENFELLNCIKYVRPGYGFVPAFPLAGKGDVNGVNENPVFTFLKARCPAPMGLIANRSDITWTPIRNNDISWNFQKWLIKSDGQPFKRYTSRTTPQAIEDDINLILDECENKLNQTQTVHQSPQPVQPAQQPVQQFVQPVQQPGRKKRRSLFDIIW